MEPGGVEVSVVGLRRKCLYVLCLFSSLWWFMSRLSCVFVLVVTLSLCNSVFQSFCLCSVYSEFPLSWCLLDCVVYELVSGVGVCNFMLQSVYAVSFAHVVFMSVKSTCYHPCSTGKDKMLSLAS